MKKIILKSIRLTLIVNALGAAVTIFLVKVFHVMPIKFTYSGGEYTGYSMFGVLWNIIYSMDPEPVANSTSESISFDPYSLIVTLVGFFLLFTIIQICRKKTCRDKTDNKKHEEQIKFQLCGY